MIATFSFIRKEYYVNYMSESFLIKGGNPLKGEVKIGGAKNHAIKMFPASLLSNQPITLHNVPEILDIKLMTEIIQALGGEVSGNNGTYTINPAGVNHAELPGDLVVKMRASFLFIIPLLHRFKEVVFPHPGGDAIGRRPIDMTLDFLYAMGATVEEQPESYIVRCDKLKGINHTFKWITHTGTEAIIMAAVLAEGRTVVKNAALEPEVVALAEYLNSVGAKISGAGTATIIIDGVDELGGGETTMIPDRIDAGSFAMLGAMIGDPLTVSHINTEHLDVLWKYFDLMNIDYTLAENSVTVRKSPQMKAIDVKTHEYPGFASDLQPPMTLLLTQAHGLSLMHETIYDGRLFFTDLLNKMGAEIRMADPHRVFVSGPSKLYGKKISSPDLRAGVTAVMAALIAEGQSEIGEIFHIDRGYESIELRLRNIGADIQRVKK